MDLTQLEACLEASKLSSLKPIVQPSVSLETEIPEVLYKSIQDFIRSNPNWDQYKLMSSALANFLFLNGCEDRKVTEKYLNDMFCSTNS